MSTILKEPNINYHRPSIKSKDYYTSFGNIPTFIQSHWGMPINESLFDKLVFIKQKETEYILEVNGEILRVPMNLKHIADSIKEGKEILQYEDDWDDEGAIATDGNTFLKAARFIVQYAVHVYKNSSVVITAPYIDILRDGSVSVHWESTKNTQLLIIFDKRDDAPAVFYAEQGDRKIPLKGAIIPDEAVDESLAVWMKNYLH